MTHKQEVLQILQELPEDATIEDAIERLCLLMRVQEGTSQLDRGEGVSHDEAKRRILGG